jgi:phenylpropionate dioxygenase-like ring-hydroxylating dioxygenase large terminal subunit
MTQTLDDLVAEIGRTAALPFEAAQTLPPGAYTDPAFTALEVDRLFRRDWVCVGRADEIAEPGGYIAHQIAGAPVAVMRQADGSLKAFANVCRHRSAELLKGVGRVAKIVCPYHAWSYDLAGRLHMAPFMGERFDKAGVALPALRCDQWEGWIYVTGDPDVAPISGRLASLSKRIADYRMAGHVTVYRADEVWACNWKSLAENFTESYHLFSSHKDTLQPFTPTQGVWCEPGDAGWNIHWMDTSRPQTRLHDETPEAALATFPLMHCYPSHVVSVSFNRGFWMSLQPDGPDRVKVLWGVTAPGERVPVEPEERAAFDADIKATFDAVNLEDRAIVESIARSLKSPFAGRGRLGEKERTLWEFWGFLARAIGAPLPSAMAAAR